MPSSAAFSLSQVVDRGGDGALEAPADAGQARGRPARGASPRSTEARSARSERERQALLAAALSPTDTIFYVTDALPLPRRPRPARRVDCDQMPEKVIVEVFHFTRDGLFFVAPEERERPTWEDEVAARMEELRREHPDGRYPPAYAEHPPGECVECDALRALDDEG